MGSFEAHVLRYSAFPVFGAAAGAVADGSAPPTGNPAGVALNAQYLTDQQMQSIAARIGYPETAFVVEPPGVPPAPSVPAKLTIRYFSPKAEVPFCGHATIATGAALATHFGAGQYIFRTTVGDVVVDTDDGGTATAAARADAGADWDSEAAAAPGSAASVTSLAYATFTSVEPETRSLPDVALGELLGVLGLAAIDLDPAYPPREAFAGNWHPVIVLRERTRFDQFRFDPRLLAPLMAWHDWDGTVLVAWAAGDGRFRARNLFPVGAVNEDPATGSAAAAFGGYLRLMGLVKPPANIVIFQGEHVGRPCRIAVEIPPEGGIRVTGTARPIPAPVDDIDAAEAVEGFD